MSNKHLTDSTHPKGPITLATSLALEGLDLADETQAFIDEAQALLDDMTELEAIDSQDWPEFRSVESMMEDDS